MFAVYHSGGKWHGHLEDESEDTLIPVLLGTVFSTTDPISMNQQVALWIVEGHELMAVHQEQYARLQAATRRQMEAERKGQGVPSSRRAKVYMRLSHFARWVHHRGRGRPRWKAAVEVESRLNPWLYQDLVNNPDRWHPAGDYRIAYVSTKFRFYAWYAGHENRLSQPALCEVRDESVDTPILIVRG